MKNEQEKMKKLMQDELDREAEQIQAEVEADESLQDTPLPSDMDGELQRKIQEYEKSQAAQAMLSREDQEALRLGRELQMQKVKENGEDSVERAEGTGKVVRFRRKKRVRILAALVAALALVMGATAIGGQPFSLEVFNGMLAGRENINISSSNGEEGEVIPAEDDKEEQAYQKIKEEFGFDPVRLNYLPDGAEFENIVFLDEGQEVVMTYSIQGKTLEYRIYPNFRQKSAGYDIEDEAIDEYTLEESQIPVEVNVYQVPQSMEKQYVAQFEYKSTFYVLNYVTSQGEIEKILKNLKFL